MLNKYLAKKKKWIKKKGGKEVSGHLSVNELNRLCLLSGSFSSLSQCNCHLFTEAFHDYQSEGALLSPATLNSHSLVLVSSEHMWLSEIIWRMFSLTRMKALTLSIVFPLQGQDGARYIVDNPKYILNESINQ